LIKILIVAFDTVFSGP